MMGIEYAIRLLYAEAKQRYARCTYTVYVCVKCECIVLSCEVVHMVQNNNILPIFSFKTNNTWNYELSTELLMKAIIRYEQLWSHAADVSYSEITISVPIIQIIFSEWEIQ